MSEARRIHIDIGDNEPLCGTRVNGPSLSSDAVEGIVCRKCQEQIYLHFKPIRDAAEVDKASTYDPMEHERDYS